MSYEYPDAYDVIVVGGNRNINGTVLPLRVVDDGASSSSYNQAAMAARQGRHSC
jgi:hypothetical protein